MIIDRRSALLGMTAIAGLGTASCSSEQAAEPAQSAGFSNEGIAALNQAFHDQVDQQKLAGIVTLLSINGEIVNRDAYGEADAETGAPIATDTIFRIASMTKPIAGLAMMQLWEKGLWKLDDPVALHIPEFEGLEVRTADGGTEPAEHAPTMAELMSHTAGFGVSARYDNLSDGDLQDMIDILAGQPLYSQPGTDWAYGPSVNVQGYIVEKLSGMDLAEYMQANIFDPLQMPDTQFWVDPAKAGRVAAIHTYNDDGQIVRAPGGDQPQTEKPQFLSGSGGLYSTVNDYWRFAQSQLNGGELDGARVLQDAGTVEVMRTNVLRPGVLLDLYGPEMPGLGFGMDYAIVMDPQAAATSMGVNSFYWGGAFGTAFWIDPTNDIVFVGMIQNQSGSTPNAGTPLVRETAHPLVYAALENPAA
jgi:CubicO group peptidase (beta-lactamase class C family)